MLGPVTPSPGAVLTLNEGRTRTTNAIRLPPRSCRVYLMQGDCLVSIGTATRNAAAIAHAYRLTSLSTDERIDLARPCQGMRGFSHERDNALPLGRHAQGAAQGRSAPAADHGRPDD